MVNFKICPEKLCLVQVRTLTGPLQALHRVLLKPLLCFLGGTLQVVVLLKCKPSLRPDILTILEKVLSQDCSKFLCICTNCGQILQPSFYYCSESFRRLLAGCHLPSTIQAWLVESCTDGVSFTHQHKGTPDLVHSDHWRLCYLSKSLSANWYETVLFKFMEKNYLIQKSLDELCLCDISDFQQFVINHDSV